MAVAAASVATPVARAGEPADDAVGARAIARAGAVVVAVDDPTALAVNPAGLARRSAIRATVDLGLRDLDIHYAPAADDAAAVDTRGPPRAAPSAGVAFGVGDGLVAAIAYVETADYDATTDEPVDALYAAAGGADVIATRYPHRYAGTALAAERRGLFAGAAIRATSWLAVGAAAEVARSRVRERKTVWAGFAGVFPPGTPARDLALSAEAAAWTWSVAAGAVAVPDAVPIEAAVAVRYTATGRLDGSAVLRSPQPSPEPRVIAGDSAAHIDLASTATGTAGLRWIGDRASIEVDAGVRRPLSADPPAWSFDLQVQDQAATAPVAFTGASSALSARTVWSARTAVDVALVDDFLWLRAGYGFRTGAAVPDRIAPTYADLASHTVSAGAEAYWRDVSLSVGFARSMSSSRAVTSARVADNPVGGGTFAVGSGRYDRTVDVFAIAVEVAWDDAPADDLFVPPGAD